MCGIAGIYLRDPSAKADVNKILSTMLDCIEHRGGDATGFVALGDEGIVEWQKAACGASEFDRYRRPVPKGTRTLLAHTRWATLGLPAFVENNHPVRRGAFFVIHNGHVSNHDELFQLAKREPYGQVDSESIPARFASLDSLAAAPKVMAEIEGAAAIAAVDERKPGELLLARGHSSPLFVLQTKRYVLWGSTVNTIEKAYRDHIGSLPKKAKIQSVPQGVALHYVDGKLRKMKFKPYDPPKVVKWEASPAWKDSTTEYGNYTYAPPALLTTSGGDLGETMACDLCEQEIPWNLLNYEEDAEGYTWHICNSCDPADIVSNDVAHVSSRIAHMRQWDPIEDED